MVSESLFRSSPSFPEDVPLAQLAKISLARLSSKDVSESKAMFEACQQYGFFLLDLKGIALGEEMIGELEQIFGVVEQTMHIPDEAMAEYKQDLPNKVGGFKREGVMKTETGQRDRCTFFAILQDDLLGNIPEIDTPEPIRQSRPLLKSYIQHAQQILSLVLAGLEHKLALPLGTLRDLQSPDNPSGTILRMIRSAPSIEPEDMRTSLLPHSDYGTITLLANIIGGLQVLPPGADPADQHAWRWVKPQPGCLIVNIGDAMVEWTGGLLRSKLHRVNYAPGEQRFVERFAVALLVRARGDAKMERLTGGIIPRLEDDRRDEVDTEHSSEGGSEMAGLTAWEWERKKAAMLHAGHVFAQSRGGRRLGSTGNTVTA